MYKEGAREGGFMFEHDCRWFGEMGFKKYLNASDEEKKQIYLNRKESIIKLYENEKGKKT
jgi:hypothetical protein